jgi:hypothetical protein
VSEALGKIINDTPCHIGIVKLNEDNDIFLILGRTKLYFVDQSLKILIDKNLKLPLVYFYANIQKIEVDNNRTDLFQIVYKDGHKP